MLTTDPYVQGDSDLRPLDDVMRQSDTGATTPSTSPRYPRERRCGSSIVSLGVTLRRVEGRPEVPRRERRTGEGRSEGSRLLHVTRT